VVEHVADSSRTEPRRGPRCRDCDAVLAPADISISEGVALCQQCGCLSRLSQLSSSSRSRAQIRARPPGSCRLDKQGLQTIATVSLNDIGNFLMWAGGALFWNSITGLFVMFSVGDLHIHLIGPLPDWFPVPRTETQRTLGELIFMCVFLLPFVVAGIGLCLAALISWRGKMRVIIEPDQAEVRIELGKLHWRKQFDPREVRAVELSPTKWQSEDADNRQIEIQADRTLRIGAMLTVEQRELLTAELRHHLPTK
jgi:hypothetical protein